MMIQWCGVVGHQPFPERGGKGEEIGESGSSWRIVDHDMELAGENEDADSSQHAMYHGGRDGAEPLSQLEPGPLHLDDPGQHDHDGQLFHAMLLNDLVDDDGQACGWPADLER